MSTPVRPSAFVVPCRPLAWSAPFRWLRLGWADLCRAPRLSAAFGLAIVLVSLAIAVFAWWLGHVALLVVLLSGFVFVAPLICVGLYGVARAHSRGSRPGLRSSLALAGRVVGQAGVFALCQVVILLLWARAGMRVNAFVPIEDGSLRSLIEFLAIGSALGSVFAALTFAVLRNKPAALVWAALIVALLGLGLATAFIGLALVMPWLAYATWHGYRETLDASDWPQLD